MRVPCAKFHAVLLDETPHNKIIELVVLHNFCENTKAELDTEPDILRITLPGGEAPFAISSLICLGTSFIFCLTAGKDSMAARLALTQIGIGRHREWPSMQLVQ